MQKQLSYLNCLQSRTDFLLSKLVRWQMTITVGRTEAAFGELEPLLSWNIRLLPKPHLFIWEAIPQLPFVPISRHILNFSLAISTSSILSLFLLRNWYGVYIWWSVTDIWWKVASKLTTVNFPMLEERVNLQCKADSHIVSVSSQHRRIVHSL